MSKLNIPGMLGTGMPGTGMPGTGIPGNGISPYPFNFNNESLI